MFDSIELRKVENGVIVSIQTEDGETKEYVYDNARKALKLVKELLEGKEVAKG